jgi:cytoskeletal protein CcmA (bactofilin family)
MWRRSDEENPTTEHHPTAPAVAPPATAPSRSRSGAVLGRSLRFEGSLGGEEDLVVEGRFAGEISTPGHQVTIGTEGRVDAEIRASVIVVEGEVQGNLTADQQVVVRASGKVHGDIRAPRVALDQGCRFKGTIDMEPGRKEGGARNGVSKPAQGIGGSSPAPEPAAKPSSENAAAPAQTVLPRPSSATR